MYNDIIKEYENLIRQKVEIEKLIDAVPNGLIAKRKIGNNEYFYLKYRNGKSVESIYQK